jgi:hypothetical protein
MQLNDDDFRGKLQVGIQQYNSVIDDPDLIQKADAALLLTHQPSDWLKDPQQIFDPLIFRSGRFAGYLCGHMHFAKHETKSWGGSAARRVFLGPSLLAMERTLTGLDHILGYEALRIEIDPTSQYGTIRCWPRRKIEKGSNDWVFERAVDFTYDKLENDDGTPGGGQKANSPVRTGNRPDEVLLARADSPQSPSTTTVGNSQVLPDRLTDDSIHAPRSENIVFLPIQSDSKLVEKI